MSDLVWTCLICGEVHPIDHEGMWAGSWMICMGCEVKARERMMPREPVIWGWAVDSDEDEPTIFAHREDAEHAAHRERERLYHLGAVEEDEIDDAVRVVPLYPGFGHVQRFPE